MTTSVSTGIEIVRSSCHRSTWLVYVGDGYTTVHAGPFNIAKRAAEVLTERTGVEFEWVQVYADAWSLHILEPDPF